VSGESARWGHARIPRASPPSATAAVLSALALIAVIIAGCLAAAASGPLPVRNRDDFMSQPLVPHVLTPVTAADARRSRLLLP
jgi:hypothetical protein